MNTRNKSSKLIMGKYLVQAIKAYQAGNEIGFACALLAALRYAPFKNDYDLRICAVYNRLVLGE